MVDFYSSGPEPANFQAIKIAGFAAITGAYTAVGVPTTNDGEIIALLNDTDALLYGSVDGINDHFYLPANSAQIFDLYTNRKVSRKITQFYIKHPAGAPSKGNFAVQVVQ